ncbi:hypothetical protein [Photorhabdus australis]|uniref:hypothetical protein n=1 Tax=Photorhabdus australis TaxID=286156 RepID=UPI000563D22E|nr:hypothetical protein [Photorhabdus australis]
MKDKIDNIEDKIGGSLKKTVIGSIYSVLSYVIRVNFEGKHILSIEPGYRWRGELLIPVAGPNSHSDQVLKFIILSPRPQCVWLFQDEISNVVKYFIGDVFNYNGAITVRGNSLGGGNKALVFYSAMKSINITLYADASRRQGSESPGA